MKYFSTRGGPQQTVDVKTALLTGLAPDGGLYLPQSIPSFSVAAPVTAFPTVAAQLAAVWFGEDVDLPVLQTIVRESYDFPVPIVPVGDRWICELFHGPSVSFKDFAAQFFARLLDHLLARDNEEAVILTATSGDTGSAVAAATHGRQRLRAVILYPQGRISPTQEQQITTWGGNVTAVAVPGTFDDCQRLVKSILATHTIPGVHLTSANSINIGRLLPQTFYYWWIALHQPGATIVVPSGNFGNLTAGVLAKRMGAPIARFIAATNVNDAVPRYLANGAYAPTVTQPTISNAMDVGAPSNFERLLGLYDGEVATMRGEITGVAVTDVQTRETIARVYREHGYLLDPHTAVAWHAAGRCGAGDPRGLSTPARVLLATAHPAKFPQVVAPLVGMSPPVPSQLRAHQHQPAQVMTLATPTEAALRALLC